MESYHILLIVTFTGAIGWGIKWGVERIVCSLDRVENSIKELTASSVGTQKDIDSMKEDITENKARINNHSDRIKQVELHIAGCKK